MQCALPLPPATFSNLIIIIILLSVNQDMLIWLTFMPPCKVYIFASWTPLHELLSWRNYTCSYQTWKFVRWPVSKACCTVTSGVAIMHLRFKHLILYTGLRTCNLPYWDKIILYPKFLFILFAGLLLSTMLLWLETLKLFVA